MSGCARTEQIVAFVMGELPAEQVSSVTEHLRACPGCQREQAEVTRLFGSLEGLGDDDWQPPVGWLRRVSIWAPAALLLLAVTASSWWTWSEHGPAGAPRADEPVSATHAGSGPGRAPGAHVPESAAEAAPARAAPEEARWLVEALEPDGGWPEELLGPTRQRVSQHALALLALARTDTDAAVLQRAAGWLVARQRDDGSMWAGLSDGSTDQALATAALFEAARRTGAGDLADAAGRSLDHLLVLLEQAGRPVVTHPAQLAWVVEALEAGVAAGRLDAQPALARVCSGRSSLRPACDVAALRRDALGVARSAPGLGPVYQASLATLTATGW